VRIEVRRAAQIKKGEEVVGNRVKAKIVKNKVAPPFRTAEFDIMYNEGISRRGDILTTASKLEIVKLQGSWYSFEDKKLGQEARPANNSSKKIPKSKKKSSKSLRSAEGKKKPKATPKVKTRSKNSQFNFTGYFS